MRRCNRGRREQVHRDLPFGRAAAAADHQRRHIWPSSPRSSATAWTSACQASWFDSRAEQVDGYSTGVGDSSAGFGNAASTSRSLRAWRRSSRLALAASDAERHHHAQLQSTVSDQLPRQPLRCGNPRPLVYNFPEIGTHATPRSNTNTYRLLVSLTGNAAGWDISGTAGAMYAKMAPVGSMGNIELGPAADRAEQRLHPRQLHRRVSLFAPPAQTTPAEPARPDRRARHPQAVRPAGRTAELRDRRAAYQVHRRSMHRERRRRSSSRECRPATPIYVIGTEYDRAAFAELDGNPIKAFNINVAGRVTTITSTFGSGLHTEDRLQVHPVGSGSRCAAPGARASAYRRRPRAYHPARLFGAGTSQRSGPVSESGAPSPILRPGTIPASVTSPLTGVLLA